ncbi:hypothetical protein D2E59_01945 [Mycobacteroides abscessus]|uniref:Uncharacterized protein n=1 Tax=Mycobacteroides abscessus TaxID=36809 RepID=A0ABD7HHE0_9MYCO|nr:hypothetical protein DDT46_23280 [Mycobacteroides abscessus]PVA20693.1 hypothetical protein DDJ52_15815 [Mycobacteroides abscessus]PVA35910.1 hypothetical protein DDJ88_08460 [Mycobacteroides abscessus]PVA52321.1 hypothetical protein DDJ35_01480 [Mycobacteroides abscessus]PVA78787.1 hypothetical protein DDJ37_09580 [Mycobacteroides abscessus]
MFLDIAILANSSYIMHCARRDTINQFKSSTQTVHIAIFLLIAAEVGRGVVLLAGFANAQFF